MNNGTLNWVITALLVPLAFGAYVYAFNVDRLSEVRARQAESDVRELVLVTKKDLSDRISESERRVQEALKELKALVLEQRKN